MSAKRVAVIVVIFGVACAGWWTLGTTTDERSKESSGKLGEAVETLWGTSLVQQAPSVTVEIPGSDQKRWVMPSKNEVHVALNAEYRKKGLLCFPTYVCAFDGTYTVTNPEAVAQKVRLQFAFPAKDGTYDEFAMFVGGNKLNYPVNANEGVGEIVELAPGQNLEFRVTYKTRGIREWRYKMDPKVGRVQGLNLTVQTNFERVDFPDGTLSPMSSEPAEDGMLLTWQASDLISRQDIGVTIPEKLNPGPLTSRITYFAPVCLVFFFVLVATLSILFKVNVHPMHYLFVAAGFFAFHLLLAYMAGLVNIHVAFVISAVVSVGLVTSYLHAALRGQLPWKLAIVGQLFYLVLFSYSFFLKEVTGLTVAVGSVITLAILMKVTAHLDWEAVFPEKKRENPPPVPPAFDPMELPAGRDGEGR